MKQRSKKILAILKDSDYRYLAKQLTKQSATEAHIFECLPDLNSFAEIWFDAIYIDDRQYCKLSPDELSQLKYMTKEINIVCFEEHKYGRSALGKYICPVIFSKHLSRSVVAA